MTVKAVYFVATMKEPAISGLCLSSWRNLTAAVQTVTDAMALVPMTAALLPLPAGKETVTVIQTPNVWEILPVEKTTAPKKMDLAFSLIAVNNSPPEFTGIVDIFGQK